MKKIGLYLSVLPHSGGSFQYCLTLIKNMKKLDKKKYKIQVLINSKIWKKYLPTNFSVIELKNREPCKKRRVSLRPDANRCAL